MVERIEHTVVGLGGRELKVRKGSRVTFLDVPPGTVAKLEQDVDVILRTLSGFVMSDPEENVNGEQLVIILGDVDGKVSKTGVAVSNLMSVESF
jgi:hypothetical protein